MAKISKKIKVIENIKRFIKINNLDGYIIPKNDNYFTEYSKINNLAGVTNFTGSAGFAIILKNTNYLFVDGRYSLQAQIETGNNFIIKKLSSKGVGCSVYYPHAVPDYTYYKNKFLSGKIINSRVIANQSISLPIAPHLSLKQLNFIAKILKTILKS